ncbi:MAG: serine/threonine protein kinase [Prevotella sp.]|nr:serine/threonine protein kinase [Prevotella sp.]
MQHLQPNTTLQGGKYRIVRVLGQGGFGITYLAEHPMLERKVCIKEFFFKNYCERDESTSHVTLSTKSNQELVERFRRKFLKEARVISKLHHDHIVQIHDIFEENSTAYYVMDYVEGESLDDKIKREGYLSEPQALAYIKDAASALAYIHSKSINHLDIKPGNIMLRHEDQRILLIDFGVSKRYDEETSEGTTTTPVGISHGYSPVEQYRRNGVQSFSPQSDVYSLAATLYKLLTGVTPPEATEILDEGLPLPPLHAKNVSESTIAAIVNAMKPRTQRTQSIGAFIADLNAQDEVTIIVDQTPQSECSTCGKELEECQYGGNHPKQATGIINGHEWVDLGLSVKWATCNVGASSPSDYGGFYAWGETQPKSRYNWDNYFDCHSSWWGIIQKWGIYKADGETAISPNSGHDTARENLGGTWRMPTDAEYDELHDKCKWTWASRDGHHGYVVTGPNGNSIFLPAAGCRGGMDSNGVGEYGYYWSSILSSSNSYDTRNLCFYSGGHSTSNGYRCIGRSVRPVTD